MKAIAVLVLAVGPVCDAQDVPLDACLDRVVPYTSADPEVTEADAALEILRAEGALRYIGLRHTSDPSDPQVDAIEAAFRAFQPTVVFFEGPDRPLRETASETVREAGESGLVRWLASQAGVPVRRLDSAAPVEEFAAVVERVGAEPAALFLVLREAARLRDRQGLRGADLDAAIATLLARAAPLGLPLATLHDVTEAYGRHFSTPRDWRDAPASWFDPGADDAATGGVFMAEANRASSHARDRQMARVLTEAVQAGERVFALVGRNHVPKQAPVLHCALDR